MYRLEYPVSILISVTTGLHSEWLLHQIHIPAVFFNLVQFYFIKILIKHSELGNMWDSQAHMPSHITIMLCDQQQALLHTSGISYQK